VARAAYLVKEQNSILGAGSAVMVRCLFHFESEFGTLVSVTTCIQTRC